MAGTGPFFSGLHETLETSSDFKTSLYAFFFPALHKIKFSSICCLKPKFACWLLYLKIKVGGGWEV